MSGSNSSVDDALGPTLFAQVVDACGRFEADFREGRTPRLEDYFCAAEGALRLRLFRELAALEIDLHRERGEHLDPHAYFARFPEFAAISDLSFPSPQEGDSGRASTVKTGRPGSRDIPAIPGYAVLSELGRGAMGVVYKARRVHLNRLCALKMILAGEHAGPGAALRFLAEAEAVARLRHPNVVQIYEVGEVGDLPYFSLELLEGGTLAERLAVMPMQPHEAARLLATLARAVHEAHSASIIHRDLKPANILFNNADEPKIADFGLAKRLEVENGQTITGQVMGTPSYMSPEQARGDNRTVGPPADVYALGAILYETLTG